jgi:hypothetical protein
MLEEARADLPPHAIARRWGKYVTWHREHLGTEAPYRMPDWQRHIEFELRDLQAREVQASNVVALPKPLTPSQVEQAIRDEQYDREAITFGQWTKLAPTTPHDAAFLAWRAGQDTRSPTAWGLTALDAFGTHQAALGARCACERCRTVLRVDANRRVVGERVMSPEEFETRRRAQIAAAAKFLGAGHETGQPPAKDASEVRDLERESTGHAPSLQGTFADGLGLEGA